MCCGQGVLPHRGDVSNAIDAAGLPEYFSAVGTHFLDAYPAEAGALATQDIDLPWDTRKCIRFKG